MRKIEQDMLNAVWNKSDACFSNTSVHYNEHTYTILIRLHGNLIATYVHDGQYKFNANIETFKLWPTRTTSSRLRAMGIVASIKGGQAAIDGVIL